MTTFVATVDCGATSVRVCRVDLDADVLVPEVVHRVEHSIQLDANGHMRWNWRHIVGAIIEGLERCVALGPLACIGIDTWAVDYGLLDENGNLLSDPYAYRDHRTDNYRTIVEEFGAANMYAINGLQLQPFNTIFQLAAHDHDELKRANRLLWLPELVVHTLTGVAVTERTSAGCSGLVDLASQDWSADLVHLTAVDRELLGDISTAGRVVGEWRGVPIALVAGHDTASAVAGMGPVAGGGTAFVSSGTWMLAGVEREDADTSEWARARNYTNEAGALGGIRFLRNVTGFWLLEQCRSAWGDTNIAELLAAAEQYSSAPIVNVDDESLRAPDDMLGAYCALSGLSLDAAPGLVTRSIIESIAARTAEVINEVGTVSAFDDVVLFGGAARIGLLRQRLQDLIGHTVRPGSAEAATLGNAIVQGVTLGTFASLRVGQERIGQEQIGHQRTGATS